MMKEEWKQIIVNGITYDYLISSHGRVYSLKSQKIMKLIKKDNGYIQIGIKKDKKSYKFYIHRLVAIHFIPNDDKTKTEVNHIDENKENNHVENLEWCSREYNINYGERTQKTKNKIKDFNIETGKPKRKVRCIETGIVFESINEASRHYNINQSNLIKCLKGRKETCGGYHWEYV